MKLFLWTSLFMMIATQELAQGSAEPNTWVEPIMNSSEELTWVEWFRSNRFFEDWSDWNYTISGRPEFFCQPSYCHFPEDWTPLDNQSAILFQHPFANLLAQCTQELTIPDLISDPYFLVWLRILPDVNRTITTTTTLTNEEVWPELNFTWNDQHFPLDLSQLNQSTSGYQRIGRWLNRSKLFREETGSVHRAGISLRTNFRTMIITSLFLASPIRSNRSDSANNPKGSSSSAESSGMISSIGRTIILTIISLLFVVGLIVLIIMINRYHKQRIHQRFHDSVFEL